MLTQQPRQGGTVRSVRQNGKCPLQTSRGPTIPFLQGLGHVRKLAVFPRACVSITQCSFCHMQAGDQAVFMWLLKSYWNFEIRNHVKVRGMGLSLLCPMLHALMPPGLINQVCLCCRLYRPSCLMCTYMWSHNATRILAASNAGKREIYLFTQQVCRLPPATGILHKSTPPG